MNMIERVAKAMADVACINYDHNKVIFDAYARAAIEVMKEPTEEMSKEASLTSTLFNHDGYRLEDRAIVSIYQAMIDAALKE